MTIAHVSASDGVRVAYVVFLWSVSRHTSYSRFDTFGTDAECGVMNELERAVRATEKDMWKVVINGNLGLV